MATLAKLLRGKAAWLAMIILGGVILTNIVVVARSLNAMDDDIEAITAAGEREAELMKVLQETR